MKKDNIENKDQDKKIQLKSKKSSYSKKKKFKTGLVISM